MSGRARARERAWRVLSIYGNLLIQVGDRVAVKAYQQIDGQWAGWETFVQVQ